MSTKPLTAAEIEQHASIPTVDDHVARFNELREFIINNPRDGKPGMTRDEQYEARRAFWRADEEMKAIQQHLAEEFGRRNGWKLSNSSFTLEGLAIGRALRETV